MTEGYLISRERRVWGGKSLQVKDREVGKVGGSGLVRRSGGRGEAGRAGGGVLESSV